MGFDLEVSVPLVTVFLQGILSFFSPCVLPVIPLYIGYLSGGTGIRGEDGRVTYHKGKVMLHTLFFVIGVSFAFFALGLGMSAIGGFFSSNQMLFARIGGIVVMLFGLYQLGIFGGSKILAKERKLPLPIDISVMSPLTALIMGFIFSFSWTPCVGPTLASVLLMTASAKSQSYGFLLIGVYTLGFVLPFLAVGLFTTSLLQLFKKHANVVKYTVKAGGILMILMGILMFTGKLNDITGYLSNIPLQNQTESNQDAENEGNKAEIEGEEAKAENEEAKSESSEIEAENSEGESERKAADAENNETETGNNNDVSVLPAIDFTLTDQYGNEHSLADYQGKTIFLNFWATWCPPCRNEMPDIQAIYEEYDTEGEDALIVLGVAAPYMGKEISEDRIVEFLEENGYTYPVLMDVDGNLFRGYGITSFPTTFMIDRDGNVFGYVSGQIDKSIMESIIQQTMDGVKK